MSPCIRSSRRISGQSAHQYLLSGARTTRSSCPVAPTRSGEITQTRRSISMTPATSHLKLTTRRLRAQFATSSRRSSRRDPAPREGNWPQQRHVLLTNKPLETTFMRAIVIQQYGGPEQLVMQKLPDPEPMPGHVAIQVKAFGIN